MWKSVWLFLVWLSNSILRHIPKRIANRCSNKNLYMNVYSGIIHHSQKVEMTQMVMNWWTEKQNVLCLYNGILFHLKKEWMKFWYNLPHGWILKILYFHNFISERSQIQKTTGYIIPFTWNIQNRQIYRDRNGLLNYKTEKSHLGLKEFGVGSW